MRCPVCNGSSTKVVDSRLGADGLTVRRRRQCGKKRCSFRFSTTEEIEMIDITVEKKDGSKSPYIREKLIAGVRRSLQKRRYKDDEFRRLIQNIERDIQRSKARRITTQRIGEIVMKHLKQFDKVAYIRFASVYHSFEDLEKFAEELDSLMKK